MTSFEIGGLLRSNWTFWMVAASLSIVSPAHGQDLDGDAVRTLALQGAWVAEHEEYGLWFWQEDNTVCLRIGAKDGDCADTGTWKVTGNALCYELTWIWESVGERSSCFTVRPIDGERYETVFHGTAMESPMFVFSILN